MPNIENTLIKILRSLEALHKCDCGGSNDISIILESFVNINIQIEELLNLLDNVVTSESDPIFTAWLENYSPPTEFPPSAHTHSDTEVNLTETYTGNLAGATTQKDANDILDALVGGGGGIFIRRSFFAPPFTSYRGFAPENSLETDAVWTITKTIENANGTIFNNEQVFNHKWTEIDTI